MYNKTKKHHEENPFVSHKYFRNYFEVEIGTNLVNHSADHAHRFGAEKNSGCSNKSKSDGNFPDNCNAVIMLFPRTDFPPEFIHYQTNSV